MLFKVKIIALFIGLLLPSFISSQENSSILCSDGIDNDGDGKIDCFDEQCANLPNNGCLICTDGISFADTVLAFIQGQCAIVDPDPTGALGVSDWTGIAFDEPEFVFLGQGGAIQLGFTNNVLTNSGDAAEDLWVFEIGPAVEASNLSLRPKDIYTQEQLALRGILDHDGDGYFEIARIEGSTSGLDIDEMMPGYAPGVLQFDAVEIRDVIDDTCWDSTPGADIDAVCALSSLNYDCRGVLNGLAVFDECGECLEPSDPGFNQSCADCAGVANGSSVIDGCGECLQQEDPAFNQSCADCAGIPNGGFILDDCGKCLSQEDPSFNTSCLDCRGIINGLAIIDECGECLDPNDPFFNQSCADCMGIPYGEATFDTCGECLHPEDPAFNQTCLPEFKLYIPNAFSPNGDGINEKFELFKMREFNARIQSYYIFNKWGSLIYKASDFAFEDDKWWDGKYQGKDLDNGVYAYMIEVKFYNGEVKKYRGDITLLK